MRRLLPFILVITACTPTPESTSTELTEPTTGTAPAAALVIELDAVLDGDSIRAEIDGETTEIRLLGINAPERDECWSQEARNALITATTTGSLSVIPDDRDQFGRLLGYLYRDGTNLNRQQIVDGNAIALANGHDLLPDFLAAEEEAAALERGLWDPAGCGTDAINTEVRIWSIEPDAPGRDDQNPNGEFVAITNEGAPADLTGWVLRDESSSHRYFFPNGFVLDTNEIVTVRSGCGSDDTTTLYWCANGTVWTNSGDTVLLLDDNGAVVERLRYSGN